MAVSWGSIVPMEVDHPRQSQRSADDGNRVVVVAHRHHAPGVEVVSVARLVERLRRDNVAYRRLDEPGAVTPIIMSTRKGDRSPEIGVVLRLVKEIYRKDGITFGA